MGKRKRKPVCEKRIKPNDKTLARLDYWNAMEWQGGGHGDKSADGAGLLWLTGLLDGKPVSGEDMLNAFRLYHSCRSAKYGSGTAQAIDYTPRSRTTGDGNGNFGAVLLFDRLDDVLRDDPKAWQAVQSLMFDGFPFVVGDYDCAYWVQRLVDEERRARGHKADNHEPSHIDRERLASVIRGLSAIVVEMGGKRMAA